MAIWIGQVAVTSSTTELVKTGPAPMTHALVYFSAAAAASLAGPSVVR